MNPKILYLGGILATLVYTGAVILGGMLRPGYSHVANFISELIGSGAPNRSILDPLFLLYNLLTGVFGVGLLVFVNAQGQTLGKFHLGTLGAWALIAEAVFGLVTVFFPQGQRGAPIDSTGTMHLILAGLTSLTTMLTILLVGLWLRNVPGMYGYFVYSMVSLAVVFVSGGITAAAGANNSPIAGILERVTIGGFLQWMLVMALKLIL